MILVIAEHNNKALQGATKHAVTAAGQMGGDIAVLVAGAGCEAVAKEAAQLAGVAKVLLADSAEYAYGLAENMAPLVAKLAKEYSHVVATATTTGKDMIPRAAALADCVQVSDIIKVVAKDTFVRPVYAGNVLETVQCGEATMFVTVRQTGFAPCGVGGNAAIEKVAGTGETGLSQFVSVTEMASERPELTAARIVVSGGRGFGSAENFKKIEKLADMLGAAIGASRAAVDAGYVPNDYQVGQTGKVVAPDLYIAIGISGAIQHLAGMKDSKVIVAINKDENAPIFELADYGLVADWQMALPELEAALAK